MRENKCNMKPVEIATRSFKNQKEATEFFKEMLGGYKPGDCASEADSLDLSALLVRHPEYQSKAGVGVDHFEVMMTVHGTKCFRVVRKDKSATDFSYLSCITGKAPTQKQQVSEAFRWFIRFDLYEARDKFIAEHEDKDGFITCAETRERVRPDDAQIDHRPPMTFEVLLTTFLVNRGLSWDTVPITSGKDGQVSPELTDPELGEQFRQYHAKLAVLDYVKKKVNLAQASPQRIKKGRMRLPGADNRAEL
jgi:Protein of unknown function (DUF3223)